MCRHVSDRGLASLLLFEIQSLREVARPSLIQGQGEEKVAWVSWRAAASAASFGSAPANGVSKREPLSNGAAFGSDRSAVWALLRGTRTIR